MEDERERRSVIEKYSHSPRSLTPLSNGPTDSHLSDGQYSRLITPVCLTVSVSVSHFLSYDDCLEDKREGYHNCSVLYRVLYHSYAHTRVRTIVWKSDSPIVDSIGQNNRPMR